MSRVRITVDWATIEAAKATLGEGESLQQFVDSAIRTMMDRRQAKAEFLGRAMASSARARLTGQYRDSESVLAELEAIVQAKEATQNPR